MYVQTGIQLQDNFSGVMFGIMDSVNSAIGAMYDMQQAMGAGVDVSSLDAARDSINQATEAMMEMNAAMENAPAPPAVPAPTTEYNPVPPVVPASTWEPDSMEVFGGSGMERFRQEAQRTDTIMGQLRSTQDEIARQALYMDFLPPGAFQDLNSIAVRMDNIHERIRQIENNPMNIGTDVANAELEQMYAQLNLAAQRQEELNQALQGMDVSAANSAYLRLSQIIGGTEQYIRDNVDAQGQFNQQIRDGTGEAENLMRTIEHVAAAYISIQGIGNILDISDDLTQTTARLSLMNDGMQSTQELVDMAYMAAQDARGSFGKMADVVARFGNNAGDAFGSSAEVVDFANLIQKQMTIAGASTQESANATLQLSQALGSGVLRGDELNSIFEQAPNLIQNIADYMGEPMGAIRDMASEGQITADIVKAAIFAASDEINAEFSQMPMTWGQVWQSMQNTALINFQPVLQRINQLANSEGFQAFANGAMEAMAALADAVLQIFDLMGEGGSFITDNWSWISPIIYGVAGALAVYYGAQLSVNIITAVGQGIHFIMAAAQMAHAAATGTLTTATAAEIAAQNGLNGAMYACPLVWIIMLILALIAIIYAVCSAIAKMTGVANSGFGVMCGGINVVIQFFKNLGLSVANIALGIGFAISALTQNIMFAFYNSICSVQAFFYNLLSTACSVISRIAAELNKLPFVEFDYSGIASAADEYASKANAWSGSKREYNNIGAAFDKGMNTFDAFGSGWAKDAFNAGVSWGDGISDKVSGLLDGFKNPKMPEIPQQKDYGSGYGGGTDGSGYGGGIADGIDGSGAAGNISDIKDSVSVTQEELKYLRDLAEQETVNRYTVAEIHIDQTNNNNVSGGMDLDGVVTGLTDAVKEAAAIITEGVHG